MDGFYVTKTPKSRVFFHNWKLHEHETHAHEPEEDCIELERA